MEGKFALHKSLFMFMNIRRVESLKKLKRYKY
jgi:hypothetical protein